MLTIYRRHVKNCQHRNEGRKYRRCRCPIWVDGFLNGEEIRESLGLRDWEKAQQKVRECEAEGRVAESEDKRATTLEEACVAFIADAKSRELQESTLRKYRQLTRQMEIFAAGEGLRYITEGRPRIGAAIPPIVERSRQYGCEKTRAAACLFPLRIG